MTSRRNVLRLLGGAVLVAGAGGAGWTLTRDPAAARAPWEAAGGRADPRLNALSYAILAPNPHNMQPWIAELRGADEIVLHCDLARRLPMTDPYDRQITIGLGCFLETLAVAASAEGYAAEITPFPEGVEAEALDARPVAQVRLVPGAAKDPLFDAIPRRRTNKEAYDGRPVAAAHLAALRAAAPGVAVSDEAGRVARLREIGWRAHEVESYTPRTLKESLDVMRFTKTQINAAPDGIDLGGPMLEALHLVGELTPEKLADTTSPAFQQGLTMYRGLFDSAAAWLWLTGPATRAGELQAGRAWMRIALTAAAEGVDLHPVSQSLQEYPEMDALFAEVHAELGVDPASGERVHMLARLGYGPQVKASPRWPVEARIRGA
ncbi:MAG: twin-arginine translocation pathway signal protein [Pseudomonadota bacterium]